MDIASFDSVIFTCASADGIIHAFINLLREQWPIVLMDVELIDAKEERLQISSSTECLSIIGGERHSIICFYRDEQMKQHFKHVGISLDSSNEGPFCLHIRKRRKILFELAAVNELTSSEDRIGVPEPYPAILCSPALLEITLVSPGNPTQDPFSQRIFSLVLSCV